MPVVVILPAAKLPVYVGKYAATFVFEYVAGNPVKKDALPKMYAPEMLPLTDNDANVPTEVMLGCALVVNVPVKKLAVTKLPSVALPEVTLEVTFKYPATFTPVDVKITVFPVPPTPTVILPFNIPALTLLVPLLINDPVAETVDQTKLPVPSVCKY